MYLMVSLFSACPVPSIELVEYFVPSEGNEDE